MFIVSIAGISILIVGVIASIWATETGIKEGIVKR